MRITNVTEVQKKVKNAIKEQKQSSGNSQVTETGLRNHSEETGRETTNVGKRLKTEGDRESDSRVTLDTSRKNDDSDRDQEKGVLISDVVSGGRLRISRHP